jgi:AraC family carnitine catabolism transcriptional activator
LWVSYKWHILTTDGGPVVATNAMMLQSNGSFLDVKKASLVFVMSGFNTHLYYREVIGNWLRQMRASGAMLGGIDGGPFVLAEADLLANERVALHWDSHQSFAARYPKIDLTASLFEIQRKTVTCAGGTASIDMMLSLIKHQHGVELATQVSDWLILGRIRNASDPQRLEIAPRFGTHNPKVGEAIRLMLDHLDSPLPQHELAAKTGVTLRQLQRLFTTHLQATPSQFYLRLRLDQARELLQQTTLSIAGVSSACGFLSGAHFSRVYAKNFHVSPSEDRLEDSGNRKINLSELRKSHRTAPTPAKRRLLQVDASLSPMVRR